MNRPYVICHMLMSKDGKVTGDFLFQNEASSGCEKYYEMNRLYNADAFACGRVTMEESFTKGKTIDLSKYVECNSFDDHIVLPIHKKYAVSYDRFGRLGWTDSVINDEDPGYGNHHIIEVLTTKVDKRYLTYLKEKNISYIFAGDEELNISLSLEKLYKYFDIKTLLLEGGAIINTAFEKEQMIDELTIVEVPLIAKETDKKFFMSDNYREYKQISLEICSDFVVKKYKIK